MTAAAVTRAPPGPSLAEQVLDGAERAFERFGVRACTMDQIAREAGVSRVTVYRHVGPKDEVFREVVLRNTRGYFSALAEDFADARSLHDMVRAVFDRSQASYRSNRLYQTLLKLEPDTVLRMQTVDAAGYYVQGVPFLAPYLTSFLDPAADPELAAEWIIRVAISLVGTSGHLLDPYDPRDLEQLVRFTVDGIPAAA